MNRWMVFRSALLAAVFFVVGFLMADRMTPAKAETSPVAQDIQGAAFSGSDGAFVTKSGSGTSIFIIRGNKVWKLDPNQSQSLNNKVWGVIE
jgi:hypothetical protein